MHAHASPRFPRSLRTLALGLGLLLVLPLAHAAKWAPPDPAELAATAPTIDLEADAEILEREVVLDQRSSASVRNDYLRIKIYTQRGLEKLAKIELPYADPSTIDFIKVRTIAPDGRILKLSPKDIFTRSVFEKQGRGTHVKSFAPDGLQVGSIVEYSYNTTQPPQFWSRPFFFQTDLPCKLARFEFGVIRPT